MRFLQSLSYTCLLGCLSKFNTSLACKSIVTFFVANIFTFFVKGPRNPYKNVRSEMDRFFSVLQTTASCIRSKIGLGPGFVWCPTGHCPCPLLFSLYINDFSTDIDSEIRLFADDCVCYREIKDTEDTLKFQKDIDQLGCWARKWDMRFQLQYDANNKETDQKDLCVIYSGGNSPRKCRKYQVSWGHYHKWFAME